jgi:hypothetical protein
MLGLSNGAPSEGATRRDPIRFGGAGLARQEPEKTALSGRETIFARPVPGVHRNATMGPQFVSISRDGGTI